MVSPSSHGLGFTSIRGNAQQQDRMYPHLAASLTYLVLCESLHGLTCPSQEHLRSTACTASCRLLLSPTCHLQHIRPLLTSWSLVLL